MPKLIDSLYKYSVNWENINMIQEGQASIISEV